MRYHIEQRTATMTFELNKEFLGDYLCPDNSWLEVSAVVNYTVETDGFDYDYGEGGGHHSLVELQDISPWITCVELHNSSDVNLPELVGELFLDECRRESLRYLGTADGQALVSAAIDRDLKGGR